MNSREEQEYGLMIRYLRNETDSQENARLLDWIKSSVDNERLFFESKLIWDMGLLTNMPIEKTIQAGWKKLELEIGTKENHAHKVDTYKPKSNDRFALNQILRIAAVFILAFGISWLIQRKTGLAERSSAAYFEYMTPKGAKSQVILPDGSRVWLNAESKIKIHSKNFGRNRRIYLEGEAYFEIQKDEKHPLIVETSDINIKVVGTSFNVKSYPNEETIETTLEKGKIIIENKPVKRYEIPTKIALEPNQRAVFDKKQGQLILQLVTTKELRLSDNMKITGDEQMIRNAKVQTSKYTSWKDGKLVFDNETFGNLAAKLERWYDIRIEIEGEALKNIRFTGTFEKETIEQGLDIMKLTTPITYSIDKNVVRIWMAKK